MLSTRTLLICAALAAVQALASSAISPVTPALAAVAPPLYALVAGVHMIMPILARLISGTPWTTAITAAITGVLIWPFNAIGPLVIVALVTGALAFDATLARSGPAPRGRLVLAACASAVALFLISLPVFSPDHLTPLILGATLLGRLCGALLALLAARALAVALAAVGLRAAPVRR